MEWRHKAAIRQVREGSVETAEESDNETDTEDEFAQIPESQENDNETGGMGEPEDDTTPWDKSEADTQQELTAQQIESSIRNAGRDHKRQPTAQDGVLVSVGQRRHDQEKTFNSVGIAAEEDIVNVNRTDVPAAGNAKRKAKNFARNQQRNAKIARANNLTNVEYYNKNQQYGQLQIIIGDQSGVFPQVTDREVPWEHRGLLGQTRGRTEDIVGCEVHHHDDNSTNTKYNDSSSSSSGKRSRSS